MGAGSSLETNSGESAVRALILDFGEVLTRSQPPDFGARVSRLLGVAEEQCLEAYWDCRSDYDIGKHSGDDYWVRVLERCRAAPDEDARADLLRELVAADVASWMNFREPMWEVAAAFREKGGRTAMLSNAGEEIIGRLRAGRPLERWFEVVVVSCELGVIKPSPAIYETCLERLGVRAEEALFVDDRKENVEAAGRLGCQTIHFRGDESVPLVRQRAGLE